MYLRRLDLHAFRNFESARLDAGPGLVLLVGPNGSGKTSLLEAVWMLSTGRSFRSNRTGPVIRYGAASLTVFGEVQRSEDRVVRLGITRERSGAAGIRIDGASTASAAALAAELPAQVINPDSVELVTGAPDRRRRFLDWGMFHVEPSFLAAWRAFRRSLDQRNALLRSGARDPGEYALWERPLADSAEALDRLRTEGVRALREVLVETLPALGSPEGIEMHYSRGWDATSEYRDVLAAQRDADREVGYTRAGPQRADLRFVADGRRAADALSRGQQKILACALLLAQAGMLERRTDKTGILLVDDLPAELDAEHRARLGQALSALRGQVLITSVEADLVTEGLDATRDLSRFHVEHGSVHRAD